MSISVGRLGSTPPFRGNLPADRSGLTPSGPLLTLAAARRFFATTEVLLPKLRALTALVCALMAVGAPTHAFASERMYMGAAEDEGRNSDPQVAMAKMQLAKAAGFDTIRVTAVWAPGQSVVPADQLNALQ